MVNEEQKTEDVVEEELDEEEELPSLVETGEDLKEKLNESKGRAKNVAVNPVRELAYDLVDTVSDGLDALFSVFESRRGKRKRRTKEKNE